MFTHWSSSAKDDKIRGMQNPPVTEKSRQDGIRAQINQDFPASKKVTLKFYFTNVFDIEESGDDKTS